MKVFVKCPSDMGIPISEWSPEAGDVLYFMDGSKYVLFGDNGSMMKQPSECDPMNSFFLADAGRQWPYVLSFARKFLVRVERADK